MASLTIEEVKRISSLERQEGCSELLVCLGWEPFDEEAELSRAILLDYLYDHIIFAVQRGFPWDQVCCVFELAYELHDQSLGSSLPETVTIFSRLCKEYQDRISAANLKIYTEFVFMTSMRHHKLFQYVFNQERDVLRIQHEVLVETPTAAPPFTEARGVKVWEYEQKLAKVESDAAQLKQATEEAQLKTVQKDGARLQESYSRIQHLAAPLTKEQIAALISEVAEGHITVASHSMKSTIQSTLMDLQVKLEKTCIPRPQELVTPSPPESLQGSEDEELDELQELGAIGGINQRRRGNTRAGSRSSVRAPTRSSSRNVQQTSARPGVPPRYQTNTPQLQLRSSSKDKPGRASSRASKSGKIKQ